MPDKAGVEVYRYARMTADSLVRIGRNARTRTATDGSVSAGKRPCWATKTGGISRAMGHDDFRCTGMLRDGKERFSDRGTEAWCHAVSGIALRENARIVVTYMPPHRPCDERPARNACRCLRLFGCVRILFVPSRIAAEKHESA
jgi:hypothetical protein